MKHLSTPATVTLALIFYTYLSGGQAAESYQPTLNEYGQPDLQGTWFFGSTTPVNRPSALGDRATYSAEEIALIESEALAANKSQEAPLDPDRPAPETGAYIGFEADFNFAAKRHERDKVLGEYRTSLVIEPANGQIPTREEFEDYNVKRRAEGLEPNSSALAFGSGERCLAGGLAIPSLYPMPWNANLQIVQNEDYVMIMTEMIHDARIIKLSGENLGGHMSYWNGDSVGYWDHNTLIVHTRNFRPEHSQFLMRISEELEVTEYLTPVSDYEILYRVEVMDPLAYTEKFVIERTIKRRSNNEPIYEFACHEGNYSLKWMLTGARRAEVDAEFAAKD